MSLWPSQLAARSTEWLTVGLALWVFGSGCFDTSPSYEFVCPGTPLEERTCGGNAPPSQADAHPGCTTTCVCNDDTQLEAAGACELERCEPADTVCDEACAENGGFRTFCDTNTF